MKKSNEYFPLHLSLRQVLVLGALVLSCLTASLAAQDEGGEAEPPPEPSPGVVREKPNYFWNGTYFALGEEEEVGSSQFEAILPDPDGSGQRLEYDATFEYDLFVQTDLVLPGIQSVQTVIFRRPRLWSLLEGSEIHLVIDHSRVLLPHRSHLTVYVNDENISTLSLDESNAVSTEVSIPLPLRGLKDYNELKMVVEQHYTDECEDPFDPALWTKVSRRSSLHFEYNHKTLSDKYLQYPLPLFDRLGYGPTVLRYVLPNTRSPQTMEALGLVTAALGREISYSHLAIGEPLSTIDNAPGNVILVGTPAENPEIRRLVGGRLSSSPQQGQIFLKRNPTNPYAAVLVVTGQDGAAVLNAARTLANKPRYEALAGPESTIKQVLEGEPSELREGSKFIPTDTTFELNDLGYEDSTVRGFYASPVRIELRTFPDLQFVERAQRLRVYYSYGAQLDTRLSTLEVRWNNITLKSVPLDDVGGREREVLDVNLPVQVLAPYNDLQFVFNLFPNSYDPCHPKEDDQLWGTIFGDSTFSMPRYHWAELPDLGKIRYGAYPLGLNQDLSETAIVLPDAPDQTDILAGLTLAGELGRATAADRLALKIVKATDMTEALRTDRNLVLIRSGNANSEVDNLRRNRALYMDASETRLNERGASVLQAVDTNAHGVVEELISPYGTEKTVLVIYGTTSEYLKRAIRMITDIRLMSKLSGNIAFMGMDNEVRTIEVGDKVEFGSIPALFRAEKWGRGHVWVTIVLLLIALILLFLVLKFLLGQYRRRHHAASDEPDDDGGGSPPPPSREPAPSADPAARTPSASQESHAPDGFDEPMDDAFFYQRPQSPSGTQGAGSAPQRRLPPRRNSPGSSDGGSSSGGSDSNGGN